MDFDPDNPLAVEIQQEMAAAYFAACRKMVDSLEALKAFDERNALRNAADILVGRASARRNIRQD